MNYRTFAEKEFEVLGWSKEEDNMQKAICDDILALLDVFSKQGHSGSSAPYAINLFKKLAMFEPISPLTGKDEEWNETEKMTDDYDEDVTYQNKRCPNVFKGADGRAYDINGKVFRDKNGCSYTNRDSRVYITFPYIPKTEYIDKKVEKDGK